MTQLTLEHLETRPVLVPLRRPIIAKIGEFREWPLILIDLHTAEGVVGRSYLMPYLKESVRYIIPALQDLAERWRGQPLAPIPWFDASLKRLGVIGPAGVGMIAIAGLDMAVWDAMAKSANQPLAVYLGGTIGPVRAYNSNGLWLGALQSLEKEAAELAAEGGFTALKLRLGRERLDDDREAIRLVRQGAGQDVRVMTDFNQAQSLTQAQLRCHGLDDQGLEWFEEPIPYTNLRGYAQLTRELRTPVQHGENFYGPQAMREAIHAGAGDCVMPDLMRIGGVTGWLRSVALAGAAGLPVSSHLYPEVSSHLFRVTETSDWLEWIDWSRPILAEPYTVADGHVTPRDVPGNGLEWDEAAVKRFAWDG